MASVPSLSCRHCGQIVVDCWTSFAEIAGNQEWDVASCDNLTWTLCDQHRQLPPDFAHTVVSQLSVSHPLLNMPPKRKPTTPSSKKRTPKKSRNAGSSRRDVHYPGGALQTTFAVEGMAYCYYNNHLIYMLNILSSSTN